MASTTNGSVKYEAQAFEVLGDIQKHAEAMKNGDPKARDSLVADCFKMIAALETPGETFMRIMWNYPIHPAVIRLASDVGLFDTFKASGGSPKSTKEVAEATSIDPRLANRILKVLASFYVVREVNEDSFVSTPLADSMSEDTFKTALDLMHPWATKCALVGPDYFRQHDNKWPSDPMDCPAQLATSDSGKLSTFQIMARDNRYKGLEALMKVWLDKRVHWSNEKAGFYPVHDRLITGADSSPDAVFLVDLGGGHGQDFNRLLSNIPKDQIPGRLILQDIPQALDTLPAGFLADGIEPTVHDFFTEQPIKGARTYFMHNILHNHMDHDVKRILKPLSAAMKKGYSKLLVWDHVMPTRDAGSIICSLDWTMLTFYGTSERGEPEWRALLEDPEFGLKITDIIHYSDYDQALIELELA